LEGLSEDESIVIGSYRAISRDLEDGSTVIIQADSDPAPPGAG